MPDGFGRFIVGIKATQEGEHRMDFEKRVEVQREETAGALQILLGYAGKLAERDLSISDCLQEQRCTESPRNPQGHGF